MKTVYSIFSSMAVVLMTGLATGCHPGADVRVAPDTPAARPAGPVVEAQLEQNKRAVVAFYTRTFNDKDPEGAAKAYLGDHYTQHNPGVADGVEGFLAFCHASQQRAPLLHAEVIRVLAEGDLVFTHSRMTIPDRPTRSVMDIWRIENGKIVEHWDAIQAVPENAANSNTMF